MEREASVTSHIVFKLWCLSKWWKMKVPVTITTPNVHLITSINDAPPGHIPHNSRHHQNRNFSWTHSHNPNLYGREIWPPRKNNNSCPKKNVINYHLLNPVHKFSKWYWLAAEGKREKDNVKIKRARSPICHMHNI